VRLFGAGMSLGWGAGTTEELLRACVDNLLSSDDESARSGASG